MSTFMLIILAIVGGLFLLIIIGAILSKLYARASKEISFVRTGFRGQKVIKDGGALVLPILHEIIPVNMNTLRLEVQRANEGALITRDRMRVDVQAEFYVRVKPTADSIANAAQTLGKRTMDTKSLKELVEGKFVDALRAVAAEMAMEELHEQRVDFVQKVQTAVSEDLLKNGLELESVSLTALDQTDQSRFNPQNLFDARGLTRLTEEIQARRKQRNDIEQDTEVQIHEKNLEARKKTLEIAKQEEYARLEQEREIAVRKAEQESAIATEQAEKEREFKEAQIRSRQEVDRSEIGAEQAVEAARIEKERQLRQKDIERNQAIETAEIEQQKRVSLADQERDIAIAEKSKEKSTSEAQASEARAEAVRAEEAINTARETEIANRQKAIELVEASKEAEREAIGVTTAAEADQKAAQYRAEATRVAANAEADREKIAAQAEAEAEMARAEAAEKRYAVEAEGKRQLHEAENILEPKVIAMQIKQALIENLETIIRESVKPIQAIEGIKIVHVEGLHPAGGNGGSNKDSSSGNLADQVVNSALRYRSQAPLVDSLLQELGLSGGDLHGLTGAVQNLQGTTASEAPAEPENTGKDQ